MGKLETNRDEVISRVKEFCVKHLEPIAKKLDEEERFPTELLAEMGQAGFFGVDYPVEYGGGYDAITAYQVIEELGKVSVGVAVTVHVHWMVADIILKFGTDAQKSRYLPALMKDEKLRALLSGEPKAR